jgi:type IV pilus assembly protein PilB
VVNPPDRRSVLIGKGLYARLAPGVTNTVGGESYPINCWNCLGEFDALAAVWCSHDPKNPTKLCPFCLHCFCDASEKFKKDFWSHAPQRLVEEVQTLSKGKDRLGDILIRMKKVTIPQLLEALVDQKRTSKKLGEVLIEKGLVHQEDVDAALKSQGVESLSDTGGVAYAASPVWEHSSPEAIIQYILTLAARRGASDVHIEPKEDAISVKYRIDGFFFRVDPIPKSFQQTFTQKLFEIFRLDPHRESRPQTSRSSARLADNDFDLVTQTLPTPHGVSATVKLVNRATFIKDFATLGLEIEERVHLMEQLRGAFGLILVTSPAFNGAGTTGYSIMNYLVHAQRNVVSLEAPVHWRMDGVRQVEVETDARGLRMEETLRSVVAVRPEALVLSSIPDRGTADLLAQLATSVLAVALMPAQTAGQGITALLSMGVPPPLVANSLVTVTSQRLIRRVCSICRQPAEPPAPQTLALHGISAEEAATLQFFRGKGCPTCNKIGYRGRQAVFEVLAVTPEVRGGILGGLTAEELETLGVGAGMRPIRDRCLDLVRQGVTTFDEFARLRF